MSLSCLEPFWDSLCLQNETPTTERDTEGVSGPELAGVPRTSLTIFLALANNQTCGMAHTSAP